MWDIRRQGEVFPPSSGDEGTVHPQIQEKKTRAKRKRFLLSLASDGPLTAQREGGKNAVAEQTPSQRAVV